MGSLGILLIRPSAWEGSAYIIFFKGVADRGIVFEADFEGVSF
jgi:hypothetical protein